MDTQIAWWLSPDGHGGAAQFTLLGHVFPVAMRAGAGAKLSIAQRIYLLPVGIFGVAMATAVFPPMARAAADNNMDELKRLLVSGLRKTLFLSIPASLGMILVAKPSSPSSISAAMSPRTTLTAPTGPPSSSAGHMGV